MDDKIPDYFSGLFSHFVRSLAHAIYDLDYVENKEGITSEGFLTHLKQCIDQSHEREAFPESDYAGLHLLVELLQKYLFEIDVHRLKQNPNEPES